MTDVRVILFHKHPVSAKVRFLQQAYGGICGFDALPKLSSVLDEQEMKVEESVVAHPKMVVQQAEQALQLDPESLKLEQEYLQRVDVPNGQITVYLAGFKGHDTPDEKLAEHNARLRLITEMRGLPPAEMELLRRAYVTIMEG